MTFPRSFDPLLLDVLASHRDWESQWPPVSPDASQRLNPDALRGICLDQVVLDEYAQMREGV